MAFRLRHDVEEWFGAIRKQKPIETNFDVYYLCLMLGLASGRSSQPSARCEKISEGFVDNFVSSSTNVQTNGVEVNNAQNVHLFLVVVDGLQRIQAGETAIRRNRRDGQRAE